MAVIPVVFRFPLEPPKVVGEIPPFQQEKIVNVWLTVLVEYSGRLLLPWENWSSSSDSQGSGHQTKVSEEHLMKVVRCQGSPDRENRKF